MPEPDPMPARSPSGFLFLHGIDNLRPPEHWQHWLVARLRERGHAVAYPALPEPFSPRPARWREAVLDALGELPAEPVVVCHSLSSLLWVRMAAAGDLPPAERVLLVSPPHDERLPPNGTDFTVGTVDGDRVRSAVRLPPRIVRGDEDPYLPGDVPRWAEEIGADVDVLPGVGHVTPDDGHGPWPSCERWCLDPSTRITA
jgi:uncharacterized protein